MNITFFNDDYPEFDNQYIQKSIQQILIKIIADEECQFEEIRIIWVSDEILKNMHIEFMNDANLTDVITFDYDEDAELYISVDRAKAVHEAHNHSFEKELIYYAIHGCLHLCGYDDHEEQDILKMRKAEQKYLDLI